MRPFSRSQAIDALRAVAVVLVLGRHLETAPVNQGSLLKHALHWVTFQWNRGGWIGVDLFFVLSGFLVSGLLFTEFARWGQVSIKNFLIRRGLKIYPAFWVFIVATSLVYSWEGRFSWLKLVREVFFVQNYWPGFWLHTWSLAVEEHFYLLLVLLFAGLTARPERAGLRYFPLIFCVWALLSLALRSYNAWNYPFSNFVHMYPSHLRLDSLLCGVLVAYFYHLRHQRFMSAVSRFRPLLAGLGVLGLVPWFFQSIELHPLVYSLGFTMIYASSALLLMALLELRLPESRMVKSVAYLGSHSYSVYLWHMPVEQAARALLSVSWGMYFTVYIGGSFVLGILLSRFIEWPVLAVRDRYFPSRAQQGQENPLRSP